MRLQRPAAACLAILLSACNAQPEHGPQRAFAGRLSDGNFAQERVPGPASQGLPGDFYLRNDVLRVIVQAPGRAIGPCPWGGNILDVDFVDRPAGDQLGELSPFLQLGRTVEFTDVAVQRDGTDGGPAVIVAHGVDQLDDFINVVGLAGFTAGVIPDPVRPSVTLGLQVTATYTLSPGDDHVTVAWSFHNPKPSPLRTTFGTLTDTGANIEVFHPGVGYGEFSVNDLIGGSIPLVEYVALQGQGISYGVLPIEKDAAARGTPIPIAGVDVEVYDQSSFADALTASGQRLLIGPNDTVTRTVELTVGRFGAGSAETARRTLAGTPRGALDGHVTGDGAGARIAFLRDDGAGPVLVTTFVADGGGAFQGALPPGRYVAVAEGAGYRRSLPLDVTVSDGASAQVVLQMVPRAQIHYRVRDGAGAAIPAKISVVGAPANPPDRRFRDVIKDPPQFGLAAWLASRHGDSERGDLFDHPIALAPARYRVVVSRGPEWSRFEQIVDLTRGDQTVDATLFHVVDTSGYVGCDFHQHTYVSPDSPVSPEERLAAYLADGAEFLSSSEHDVIFDYRPVIDALDARGLIDSGIGVETTPFDYGHFIAFPLVVDNTQPNGGAFDWGNGGMGDLSPGQIFAGLKKQGARVVQVNHPRTPPGGISFQQNFDRAALRFDWSARTFFSDATQLELSARDLGLPDAAELFSPDFNSIEVLNGFLATGDPLTPDRERSDLTTDANLRDWMSFLTMGFVVAATGDSDSHTRWSAPSGIPRTMVAVPDDSPAAIARGVGDAVVATVSGLQPRDIVVTNGPMIALHAGAGSGSSIGRVVPANGPLPITVSVRAPEWAPVDTVELYANASFDIPAPKGQTAQPLVPALCFTSRPRPSWRCQQAIGGARPLTPKLVTVGANARRQEIDVAITIDPAQLTARQRPGGQGKDLWLVARALGSVGMFPTVPLLVDAQSVTLDDLVAGKPLQDQGVPALAFTNPVFVDVDGGGWRAPFAP